MRTLGTSFLIILITHPLTQAVQTVDEFCADLSVVNSHLTSNFVAFFNVEFTALFECNCNTTEPETLVVDCVGVYDNIDAVETTREQAILIENNNGTFTLVQTAWSDTFYDSIDVFQGIYVFQYGEQISCTMTGCASCSICPDGASIAVDCSALAAEYTSECSDQYIGAFLSSFGFQIIAPDNTNPTTVTAVSPTAGPLGTDVPTAMVPSPNPLTPPAAPKTAEEFCADLSDLEAHMKSSFEETVFVVPAENNYECECSTPFDASMLVNCDVRYGTDVCTKPDDFALIIDCSLFYGDEDEPTINFEQAIFEKSSNGTRLDLQRTGWGDTSITIGIQEFFFFENGSLDECFGRNNSAVGVCTVCPDGGSLSFCSDELSCDIPCSDMYTGAFFNTYDFNLLATPMDTTSPISSPTVAPTGSPITAVAPMGRPVTASNAPTASPPINTTSPTSSPTMAPTGSPIMANAPTTTSPTLAPIPAPDVSPGSTSASSAGGVLQPVIGSLVLVAATMTLS